MNFLKGEVAWMPKTGPQKMSTMLYSRYTSIGKGNKSDLKLGLANVALGLPK